MERIRPDTCSVSRETSCSRRASVPLGARRQRKDKARRGAWQRTRSRRGTWQRKDRCGRRRRRAWRRGGHGGGRATRAAGADALGAQPRNVAAKRPRGARDVEVLEGVTAGRTSRSREHSGGGGKSPVLKGMAAGREQGPAGGEAAAEGQGPPGKRGRGQGPTGGRGSGRTTAAVGAGALGGGGHGGGRIVGKLEGALRRGAVDARRGAPASGGAARIRKVRT